MDVRQRSAAAVAALTLGTALAVAGVAPVAHAAPSVEADRVLVTNQDGPNCPYNNQVLIANPFDGTVDTNEPVGRPSDVDGVVNEAKPLDRSTRILALWGSYGTGKTGGVGIFDRTSRTWTVHFPFPSNWENVSGTGETAHSAEELPDGNIVVATVGHIGGTGKGWLVLFSPSGSIISSLRMPSAHGVAWDGPRTSLFATSYDKVWRVRYDPSRTDGTQLRTDGSYDLPKLNGHDIQRRRTDNQYYVTVDHGIYVFNPDAVPPTTPYFTELLHGDGTPYDWIKSVDERFDGLALYAEWKTNVFSFLHSDPVNAQFCSGTFYKTRWIYHQNEPLYREDDATPGYNQVNFVATTKLDKPANQQQTMAKSRWVGAHANSYWPDVSNTLTADLAANKVPYLLFYEWGNYGMDHFTDTAAIPQSKIDDWITWAANLASVIGTHEAFVVVEPEWDTNIPNACSPRYISALTGVVAKFRRKAPNVHLINGMGLWNLNPGHSYDCFTNAAAMFDLQGVSLHLTSDYYTGIYDVTNPNADCATWPGGRYRGAYSLSGLTGPSNDPYVLQLIRTKAAIVHSVFHASNFVIDDMAVTRCKTSNPSVSFGDAGQTQLLDIMTTAFPSLYDTQGFRGYMLRDGGPGDATHDGAKAMGVGNENGFDYVNNPNAVTEVNDAATNMETHVTSVTAGSTGPPTFTAEADVPPTVTPGGPASITARVTDNGGPLTNGTVTIDILDSGGAVVATQPFTGQTFGNNEMKPLSWTWTASQTAGTYTVRVQVTANGGSPSYYSQNVASIVVAASGPTFTAAEVASPRTIRPGDTTTLDVTVTDTGGSLNGADVTVTTYDPSGAQVGTTTNPAQSFAAGDSKSYQVPFTAPANAQLGTYTARVTVTGVGGSPSYPVNDSAGTFDVVTNQFTSTATASHGSVSPGSSATITATFTDTATAISNVTTEIDLYDPAGTRVVHATWPAQSFTAGGQLTFSTTWTPTTSSPTGTYTVQLGVSSSDGTLLHWNDHAATTGVANAAWTLSATAAPLSVAPSGTTSVTAYVTNDGGSYDNANVDIEIYNSAGAHAGTPYQKTWSGQTVGDNETKAYTFTWTAPATAGTYTVKVGVMAPSWTPTLKWNDNAARITVTAPTFTATATLSASSALPGQGVTITATFTATGGALVSGKTDVEVYDSAGHRAPTGGGQAFWTDSLSDGQSVTHTYNWPGVTTPGTYTVKLGVFSGSWGTQYYWKNNAGTIVVGSGTYQPTFTVGGGANSWWVEVYTPSDVTSVDAIGRDGQFYLPLVKRSWGAWAATAPSALANGDHVQFVARRSTDGASAASTAFGWLTQTPTTTPGWSAGIVRGVNCSTTWAEAIASSSANEVWIKAGTGSWTLLTYNSGIWGKAMNISAGTKVLFKAKRGSDSAWGYSAVYSWLQ